MTSAPWINICYDMHDRQATWCGIDVVECESYRLFVSKEVSSRLYDEEGSQEFEACLRGLATTGFARESLNAVLTAENPEEKS